MSANGREAVNAVRLWPDGWPKIVQCAAIVAAEVEDDSPNEAAVADALKIAAATLKAIRAERKRKKTAEDNCP